MNVATVALCMYVEGFNPFLVNTYTCKATVATLHGTSDVTDNERRFENGNKTN